jgi:hypothetical protein
MGDATHLIGTKKAIVVLTIRTSRSFQTSVIIATHKRKTCCKFKTTSLEMHGMARFSCCARIILTFLRIHFHKPERGCPARTCNRVRKARPRCCRRWKPSCLWWQWDAGPNNHRISLLTSILFFAMCSLGSTHAHTRGYGMEFNKRSSIICNIY